MNIPFCGPTYNAVSPNLNCSRSINLYPEIAPEGSKSRMAMIGTPGTILLTIAGGKIIRGMHVFNGLLYVTAGSGLYSVSPSGAVSASLGTLASSAGRVGMKDNGLSVSGIAGVGGNQLMITDGYNGYIYYTAGTQAGTFLTVSGNGWPGNPTSLEFLDGYFIIAVAGSMSVFASNLYDGTTWNALSTSPVSGATDIVQTVINYAQQLWIIKQWTMEVWYDTGTSPAQGFPFSRESGAVIDFGTPAPWSAVRGGNSFFFLATVRNNDGGELVGAVQVTGYTPQISTPPAIVFQWNQYVSISDAFGYCYSENGHTFYVLTFPSANATWAYDMDTKMWHERSTWTGSPYAIGRHVGNCYAFFNGMHVVGDYGNGNIYQMKSGIYQDNGQPLVSVRTAQVLFDKNDQREISIPRLIVDMEMGVGGGATLSWSKDGGHTWSNEHPGSMGMMGQYYGRMAWRKLGRFQYGFIPRITISDPCKRIILGAYAEVNS